MWKLNEEAFKGRPNEAPGSERTRSLVEFEQGEGRNSGGGKRLHKAGTWRGEGRLRAVTHASGHRRENAVAAPGTADVACCGADVVPPCTRTASAPTLGSCCCINSARDAPSWPSVGRSALPMPLGGVQAPLSRDKWHRRGFGKV